MDYRRLRICLLLKDVVSGSSELGGYIGYIGGYIGVICWDNGKELGYYY